MSEKVLLTPILAIVFAIVALAYVLALMYAIFGVAWQLRSGRKRR